MDSRLQAIGKNLRKFTADCREDMHEPDEQNISASVVGTKLDNAFGAHISVSAIVGGYQEFVVILHAPEKSLEINLADLIALARLAK